MHPLKIIAAALKVKMTMVGNQSKRLFGAIEAGGTKFVCCIGHGNVVLENAQFATKGPKETLDEVAAFFSEAAGRHGALSAIGVGSFGPVKIDAECADYGLILNTPKLKWQGCNIRNELMQRLDLPVFMETDVNCALLGEALYGAGKCFSTVGYLTIGTGIGGGLMKDGAIINGRNHPEMGHMLVPGSIFETHDFPGVCPFHENRCAEGLASGSALAARIEGPLQDCPPEHHIWAIAADYIAALCMNLIMVTMPDRIILGGGVMKQAHLFPMIRAAVRDKINGYLGGNLTRDEMDRLIAPTALNDMAGCLGAMQIAERMLMAG